MTERNNKIRNLFSADCILSFLFILFFTFFYPQTKGDVGILREEILDKMQYDNQQLEPLLKYYSKISPTDAQILRIKSLLITGDYEEALTRLLSLKNRATNNKKSELFFQYQYLYSELCQSLGLTSELKEIRRNLNNYDFEKQNFLTDLAIDKGSFSIFVPSESINILRSAIKGYENTGDSKALIQSKIWLSELLRDNEVQSFSQINSAHNLLNTTKPGVYYDVLVFNGLSKVELKKNNARAAFDYLKDLEISASSISNNELKADYYKNLARASAGINDYLMLGKANDAYFRIIQKVDSKKTVAKALLVNHINKINEEKLMLQRQTFRFIYIAVIIIFIIVMILIYSFKYRSSPAKEVISSTEIKNYVIPDKTEKRILDKLDAFEKSQKFIQKTVSMKTLAQQFDTNPKYLSEVINKHKNSNFNTYINNLRIDYIVHKIRQDPEYRKYKVSYLADECGFSSHSLFTTIFKNRMGLSPTEFLQKLNE
ncbi:helix-turn-helix domain-containing protein [Epilithonimonas mollis]|uniref:Helix-turn-helix domain-containing protein n=1 Tax=Epilithonimonas mollis TaxID=216903 RepID=A0A1M6UUU2_9FLAO|nr:AraC family transcriptional regulator [Epilithonimonas mollis]SHK72997.1 Helix-turn-helix domain-containing protein [Epilithonimonas mollis]